jgi:HSP20 family protein
MNIIRYKTPQCTAWPSTNRLSSLRDLFDSAFQWEGQPVGWTPPLDVAEDADKITVQLEAAGLTKESFDISLHDDVLTLSGERQSEKPSGENLRSERLFGAFSRSLTLPSAVKSGEVTASYQDGILTVLLPKADEAKPRKIPVEIR